MAQLDNTMKIARFLLDRGTNLANPVETFL